MLKGKYKKDSDSIAWLNNYIAVVEGGETDLEVAPQNISELKAACDELAAKLEQKDRAQASGESGGARFSQFEKENQRGD
jgi:hypothetical protein